MNRRYMDIMPAKRIPPKNLKPTVEPKTVTTVEEVTVFQQDKPIYQEKQITTSFKEEKLPPSPSFKQRDPLLGVVEDVASNNEIEKRPLSQQPANPEDNLKELKAKKIGNKEVVEKPVEKPVDNNKDKTYKMPKSPFINQEKVVKRPLSKNVYQKKVTLPVEEEKKAPVTIIEKPEKQTNAGLIITIILTIILGAAAGTVAFLLLPK